MSDLFDGLLRCPNHCGISDGSKIRRDNSFPFRLRNCEREMRIGPSNKADLDRPRNGVRESHPRGAAGKRCPEAERELAATAGENALLAGR
jgi:hypothetical protein